MIDLRTGKNIDVYSSLMKALLDRRCGLLSETMRRGRLPARRETNQLPTIAQEAGLGIHW
jgi:hypothetical protein